MTSLEGTPILRLHGYPVSNYFNIARAALIEKALPFEITIVRASQDEDFLARNPMGKIPVLETAQGWLGETVAILEFLDDCYPDLPLRPQDAFERAKGRQIINLVQIYVEAQIRSLFPGVFFSGANDPAVVASARAMLDRATGALRRLLRPAPFLFGETLSQADLFLFYNLEIAERVTRFVYRRSIRDEIGGLESWRTLMVRRDSSRIVLADFDSYFAQLLVDRNAAYRPEPDLAGRVA